MSSNNHFWVFIYSINPLFWKLWIIYCRGSECTGTVQISKILVYSWTRVLPRVKTFRNIISRSRGFRLKHRHNNINNNNNNYNVQVKRRRFRNICKNRSGIVGTPLKSLSVSLARRMCVFDFNPMLASACVSNYHHNPRSADEKSWSKLCVNFTRVWSFSRRVCPF